MARGTRGPRSRRANPGGGRAPSGGRSGSGHSGGTGGGSATGGNSGCTGPAIFLGGGFLTILYGIIYGITRII